VLKYSGFFARTLVNIVIAGNWQDL